MLQYLEFVPSLLIGMARIYPCGILVAAFCFQHIRGRLRVTIVMVMALLPAPGIHAALEGHDYSALILAALVLKEVALGLLLGVLLSMPFWMFEGVGALLGNQRGALAGGQLNPSLGPDATPMGHLFKQLAIFLLMTTLGLGALTQVVGYAQLMHVPLTLEAAEHVLASSAVRRPTPSRDTILRAVSEYYRVSLDDLKGTKRTQRIVLPRHVAMYLLREDGQLSLPQIGQTLNRDHTTVLHGVERVATQIETDEALRREVITLRDSLYRAAPK